MATIGNGTDGSSISDDLQVFYITLNKKEYHHVLLIYFSAGLCLFWLILPYRNTIESAEIPPADTGPVAPIR